MENDTMIDNSYKSDRDSLIKKAREIMSVSYIISDADVEKIKDLAKKLARVDQFYYATEVFLKLLYSKDIKYKFDDEDYRTLAKYIYKDHSLSSTFKYEKSFQFIKDNIDFNTTQHFDSFGLAGAIHKRKWYFDRNPKNIELAKLFYKKGYSVWVNYIHKLPKDVTNIIYYTDEKNDFGYNAINLCFILEQIITLKISDSKGILNQKNNFIDNAIKESIQSSISEVNSVRNKIIEELYDHESKDLTPSIVDWHIEINKLDDNSKHRDISFVYATVIEAFIGLSLYDDADVLIRKYNLIVTDSWKRRTLIEQLILTLNNQTIINDFESSGKFNKTDFEKCIELLISKSTEENKINLNKEYTDTNSLKPIRKYKNKSGIAFSGGGFRASLYHIGFLAAMAEFDLLKDIEVISGVSGGSILGTAYYLRLKNLLESKMDNEIVQQDYIDIVTDLITQFPLAVETNLRMQLFSNFWSNLKMAFNKNYSRTKRAGELYEYHFYKKIISLQIPLVSEKGNYIIDKEKLKKYSSGIPMNSLKINLNNENDFNIKTHNFTRKNKVPQLVLNATSLNTGHNFQFAATWMGESPALIDTNIDVKPRLRRMYYNEAPKEYQDFRLGYAVAASACVPGIFNPMLMPNLYKGIDLKLVDGGVHDNQGVGALLENECKNVFLSDASGQLSTEDISASGFINEVYRSDSVFQERIRELQFKLINSLKNQNYFDELSYVHLKKDLSSESINWIGNEEPPRQVFKGDIKDVNNLKTGYGVNKKLQKAISEIRTDLDAFTETEANALMYSAYLQTVETLSKKYNRNIQHHWNFLKIMNRFDSDDELIDEIKIGNNKFGKWWQLWKFRNIKNKFLLNKINYLLKLLPILVLLIVLPILLHNFLETKRIYNIDVSAYLWPIAIVVSIVLLIVFILIFYTKKIFTNVKYSIFLMLLNSILVSCLYITFKGYLLMFNKWYNKLGKK